MDTQLRIRLLSNVTVGHDGGCWEWTAHRDKHGYGRIQIDRSSRGAHRVAYETFVGPVPEGLELDHLCRNRACIYPRHLEPVTHHENMLRGAGATKDRCKNGHPFSRENTHWRKRGDRPTRVCRTCNRQAQAKVRAAKLP